MNFKFWLSLFVSVCFPLLIFFFWGLLFINSYKQETKENLVKHTLKKDHQVYMSSLEAQLSFLEIQAQDALKNKSLTEKSPFSSLILIDPSQKGFLKEYSFKNRVSYANNNSFKKSMNALVKDFNEDFRFDVLSLGRNKKNIIIFKEIFLLNSKTKNIVIGLLKEEPFFRFIPSLVREQEKRTLILNSQGRIVFHSEPQHIFKILKQDSSLRRTIQNLTQRDQTDLVLKTHKKQDFRELSYVQKWDRGQLFLVTQRVWSQPFLAVNSWVFQWMTFCLIVFLLIFVGTAITVSPIFSAYSFLKSFIIHFASTGKGLVSYDKIKNPFLYFYKNRIEKFKSFNHLNLGSKDLNPPPQSGTFQTVLQDEVNKLKLKYQGLSVEEQLDSNIKLWNFESFMRTLLHELLLNAIESMGASDHQKVTVSCWEEDKKFIFSVRDQGVGLSKKDHDKVFELYYSTKSQLGVGLNLVQSIVQGNNGQIRFISPAQKGLEVVVTLPMSCFLKVSSYQARSKSTEMTL